MNEMVPAIDDEILYTDSLPFLTGKSLRREIEKPDIGQEALIEEFLHRDSCSLIYSEPGVGKTVIGQNIMACCSVGLPVFGLLRVCKPLKVAYLQLEGSRDEALSRLAMMESIIKFDDQMISWHNPIVCAEDRNSWEELWRELDFAYPFQVLIVDPLYKLTMRGLKNEESVLLMTKFLDALRKKYMCSVIIMHHSTKTQYEAGQPVEKEDPFYGSQWLKAYMDVQYRVKKLGSNTIELLCKKSRAGNIIQNLVLDFDIVSYTLATNASKSALPSRITVERFLEAYFATHDSITINELCKKASISRRQLFRLKADGVFDNIVEFPKAGQHAPWFKKKIGTKC